MTEQFPDPEPTSGLSIRTRNAAFGSMSFSAGRALVTFLFAVVLARLLGPEPFGVMAVALAIITIGQLVVEAGTGSALVQVKTLRQGQIASALSLQLTLGAVLSACLFMLSPRIADFFSTEQLATVLKWLSPIFLIQASGVVSTSLLRRDLRQSVVAGYQFFAYVVSALFVGIPLAVAGGGVWSLVASQLVFAIVVAVSANLLAKHSWRVAWPWREMPLLRFGAEVLLVGLTNSIVDNLDRLVAGHRLGPTDTGLYSRAYLTARSGVDGAVSAVSSPLFAAFSKKQDDTVSSARAFVAVLNLMSLMLLPALAALAVLSSAVVHVIYGEEWAPMAPALAILAIAMAAHFATFVASPLLWARDRVRLELVASVVCLAILGFGLLVAGVSIVGIALAVSIAYMIRALIMTRFAANAVGVAWRRVLHAWLSGCRLAAAVAVVGWSAGHFLNPLASVVVGGGVSAALAIGGVRHAGNFEITEELRQSSRLLGPLARILRIQST